MTSKEAEAQAKQNALVRQRALNATRSTTAELRRHLFAANFVPGHRSITTGRRQR